MVTPGGETSQTLDRGLTALTLLAENEDGLTAADIADRLGTARAAVYRLLRTLEIHNLVSHEGPRYFLGFGIADLAGRLKPRLRATVLPILRKLSEQTNSTALLSVADGDQALLLVTAEPPRATFHIAMREGSRHPLDVGADGVAILAGRPASATDTDEVRLARRRGYAVTVGALQTGAVGIAAPIQVSDWATASVGVVQLGVEVDDALLPAVMNAAAARTVSGALSGSSRLRPRTNAPSPVIVTIAPS